MSKIGWVLAGVATLSACTAETPEEKVEREDRIIAIMAEDVIKAQLRDPGSAQFSSVRVSRTGGIPAVCGLVNSKNAFGGYAGPTPFLVVDQVGLVMSADNASELEPRFTALCGL